MPTVLTIPGEGTSTLKILAQRIKRKRYHESETSAYYVGYAHDVINSDIYLTYLILLSTKETTSTYLFAQNENSYETPFYATIIN